MILFWIAFRCPKNFLIPVKRVLTSKRDFSEYSLSSFDFVCWIIWKVFIWFCLIWFSSRWGEVPTPKVAMGVAKLLFGQKLYEWKSTNVNVMVLSRHMKIVKKRTTELVFSDETSIYGVPSVMGAYLNCHDSWLTKNQWWINDSPQRQPYFLPNFQI